MLAQVVQLVACAVTGTVVIFTLCLIFLLILYFKGGRRDLQAGAEALHKIRDVGVASAIRAVLERRSNRDAGSS
jgi:hypothetical protein